MQRAHLVRGPSWAAGWRRGHSTRSVGCETGETGSCSSPPLPWPDSPPAPSLCPRLTDPGGHQLQSPARNTPADIKKKKKRWRCFFFYLAGKIQEETWINKHTIPHQLTPNESLSNRLKTKIPQQPTVADLLTVWMWIKSAQINRGV